MFGDQKHLHFKFSVKFHHDTPEVDKIGKTDKVNVNEIEPNDSTARVETQVDLSNEINGQLSVNPQQSENNDNNYLN